MASAYRVLITVSIYLVAVSSAPQDSTFTYDQPSENSSIQPGDKVDNLTLAIGATNVETPTERTNQSEITPNPNDQNSPRYAREYTSSSETTEVTEATEKSEEIEVATTELNEVKPKFPSPRYISKLGYFKKSEDYEGSALKNFLERTGKRKFRSKCRCEKIWNCPRLQITVPRCPDEYFLCC
ncbi:hypothetical protein ABMA28_009014 [Loxostege sticticalis]|uniref:Uncharacterized protein n=1 Tax=Loxostege sticticalis TaxID=481309 RepID=A0ABD0SFG4_LOXSC